MNVKLTQNPTDGSRWMRSSPFYEPAALRTFTRWRKNPTDGSRWIVQVQPTEPLYKTFTRWRKNPTDGSRWIRSDPFYNNRPDRLSRAGERILSDTTQHHSPARKLFVVLCL